MFSQVDTSMHAKCTMSPAEDFDNRDLWLPDSGAIGFLGSCAVAATSLDTLVVSV